MRQAPNDGCWRRAWAEVSRLCAVLFKCACFFSYSHVV